MLPRQPRPRPLADLVEPCIGPVLLQKGFSQAGLILYWPDIVGERLAEYCEPLAIQWPVHRPTATSASAATLVVRVAGEFALELQHLAPLVIERINVHLGWRGVERLVLKQGVIARRQKPPTRRSAPTPEALTMAAGLATGIGDADLRAALIRLGARIIDRSLVGPGKRHTLTFHDG
jgi:hypothetical protein